MYNLYVCHHWAKISSLNTDDTVSTIVDSILRNNSIHYAWWRHQMETFSALLAICAGNSPVTGEFPTQRPVTRSFDVFFDLHLNKRLSKQSWGWWFETSSRPLWSHCNDQETATSLNDFCLMIQSVLDTTWSLQTSDMSRSTITRYCKQRCI